MFDLFRKRPARLGKAFTLPLVLVLAFACASPAPQPSPPPQGCSPDFAYSGGWLGGDGVYSVDLPGGSQRTLWLFGDSFVSDDAEARNRVGSTFVHNSIGVSRCRDGNFSIRYHWGRDEDGAAEAMLDTGDPERYWWLFDGFIYRDSLYLGLLEVRPAEPQGALRLPFRLSGMSLARIDNPLADPRSWHPQIASLSPSDEAFPGSSMVVHDDSVYLFSFSQLEADRQPRFLARLPLSALTPFPADLSANLETLTRGGHWGPGFLPERARPLFPDNATEMSVEFHPESRQWLAIYASPIQVAEPEVKTAGSLGDAPPSNTVYLRRAERLEGPWSERVAVYQYPETDTDPAIYCYAAKGHLGYSPPGEVLITYVCNRRSNPGEAASDTLGQLLRDMEIYRPRTTLIPLAPPE